MSHTKSTLLAHDVGHIKRTVVNDTRSRYDTCNVIEAIHHCGFSVLPRGLEKLIAANAWQSGRREGEGS